MIGGRLFYRFMLRFLMGLGVAVLLFAPLVHIFQIRVVDSEWSEDLRQEATWAARHLGPELVDKAYTDAWRSMHNTMRITFFDAEGKLIEDSHPERPQHDVHALLRGEDHGRHLAAIEAMPHGGWLVLSRPGVPPFPFGMHWELVLVAVLVVLIVHLLLYPLVRSISSTLGQLGQLAEQVADGQFGKTLDIRRHDEIGALVASFNDMSKKLAEAEKLNTRLLHDVSHELRSPLGRIQVMAETSILRPAEADRCVQGIGEEVKLLDRLVGDLLQVARFESESQAPKMQSFALSTWAQETCRRLESKVRSNKIEWATEFPQDEQQVSGDPQRLAQALGNLVDNAIHALSGHENGKIEVRVELAADAWTLEVADNGPGIPAEDLPHVFRRFYRAGDNRGRDQGGVGLGLSLVQAIVEAQEGQVKIDSQVGAGTQVTMRLPLA